MHNAIPENEMQDRHECDVTCQEDEEGVVITGVKCVGEKDQDEKSAKDLEQD